MPKSPAKKIAKDLDALLEDVTKALKASAADVSEETQESLAEAALALADGARSLIDDVKARSGVMAKAAAREVKAHPVATAATLAVAAAAVAGLLAARHRGAKD